MVRVREGLYTVNVGGSSSLTLPDFKLRIEPMLLKDPSSRLRLDGLSFPGDTGLAPNSSMSAISDAGGVVEIGDFSVVSSLVYIRMSTRREIQSNLRR